MLRKNPNFLGIISYREHDGKFEKRLNPFNPLSYIVLSIALIGGVAHVIYKELVDWLVVNNPFNWTRHHQRQSFKKSKQ